MRRSRIAPDSPGYVHPIPNGGLSSRLQLVLRRPNQHPQKPVTAACRQASLRHIAVNAAVRCRGTVRKEPLLRGDSRRLLF